MATCSKSLTARARAKIEESQAKSKDWKIWRDICPPSQPCRSCCTQAELQTSLQSKTDAIAVMKLLKTMTFRTVLISKDNNDFHDILLTLVTKWTFCGKMTIYNNDFLLHIFWKDIELNKFYHIMHGLDCEEMTLTSWGWAVPSSGSALVSLGLVLLAQLPALGCIK